MKTVSHLLKILDGAFKHDTAKAYAAALDLVSALQAEGHAGAAARVTARLERVPSYVAKGTVPNRGNLAPTTGNERLTLLDQRLPTPGSIDLVLSDSVRKEVEQFVAEFRAYEALANAGVADPARILLHGPPGVGKTSIAALIAAELQRPLFTLRCEAATASFMGETGRNLRNVFEYATANPCVLLLDEFDALAKSRDAASREVGEMHRVVVALLQMLDALPEDVIVVAASNHAESIDAAVWRRFPRKIALGLPNEADRTTLWTKALRTFKPADLDAGVLAKESEGMSHADISATARQSIRTVVLAERSHVSEAEVLSRIAAARCPIRRPETA